MSTILRGHVGINVTRSGACVPALITIDHNVAACWAARTSNDTVNFLFAGLLISESTFFLWC